MKFSPTHLYLAIGALLFGSVACTRAMYRRQADRDVYAALTGKQQLLQPEELPRDPSIEAGPESRFYDPFDPDHPPMPPDDPLSHTFMKRVDGKKGSWSWREEGHPEVVENQTWRKLLPRDRKGQVTLDLAGAMRVGLHNSREFQNEREDLYLSALDVTYERFQFSPQAALSSGSVYTVDGKLRDQLGKVPKPTPKPTPRPVLPAGSTPRPAVAVILPQEKQHVSVLTDGSVRWMAATGGELLAGFANSLVWDFDGDTITHVTGSLLNFSIVQPLLRMGGRARTLEALTQSERTLLANVRQMDQFQSGYYVRIVSGRTAGDGPSRGGIVGAAGLGLIAGTPSGRSGAPRADGFLGLLEEQQRIRNLESNVARLRESLDQLAAAFDAGRISSRLQVDQARQALFNGQSSLLSARAGYQTRLDSYKIELGLPPELPVTLKDNLLERFTAADPSATVLDRQLDLIENEIRNPERIKSHETLLVQVRELQALEKPLRGLLKVAQTDLQHLRQALPIRQEQLKHLRETARPNELSIEPERLDARELEKKVKLLAERVEHQGVELEKMGSDLKQFETEMPGLELEQARSRLSGMAGDISGLLLALSLDQTATRLESAVLPRIELDEERALMIARENRLDWMNARARLVDAWRNIGFTANPLMSGLDLTVNGNLGTLRNEPTRFDARTGLMRMGLRFDSPLNRLAERNDYREALIQYQRARREYMLFEDRISQSLRNTLRLVALSQLNFELRRAAVQVAISQVDLARLRLGEPPRPGAQAQFGATTARDLVSALSDLLEAQNDFLSLQVGYDVLRLVLDFELGTMRLKPDGLWSDPGAITEANLAALHPKWKELSPPAGAPSALAFRKSVPTVR